MMTSLPLETKAIQSLSSERELEARGLQEAHLQFHAFSLGSHQWQIQLLLHATRECLLGTSPAHPF